VLTTKTNQNSDLISFKDKAVPPTWFSRIKARFPNLNPDLISFRDKAVPPYTILRIKAPFIIRRYF